MKGSNYIKIKQIQWARRQNLQLSGSKADKGLPIYVPSVDENLFESMSLEVRKQFQAGDGGELNDSPSKPAKMRALHSSSAIGVNFFHYWKSKKEVHKIAHCCGLCSNKNKSSIDISFEKKYPISKSFQYAPNIDVVIENDSRSRYKVYAVECKFSEAYGSYKHSGIDPKYLNIESIWKDISNTHDLAMKISPDDQEFSHLHPAQLIKHILGLKSEYGKTAFRLLYLWYDVLGDEGYQHRNEINRFKEIVKADNISFTSISYQEVIENLNSKSYFGNKEYINYLSDRYL